MLIDFSGRVALVTGGGGVLGRAMCLAFAGAGARVVCVDHDRDLGAGTVEAVRRAGGEAVYVAADVTRAAAVAEAVRVTVAQFGRIDAFANNAGIEGVVSPLVDYPEEVFDQVMAVNVKGVFLGLKYVLPVMVKQQRGAVVNTASVAAWFGAPGLVAYHASKHAVLGLTRCAALEVAKSGVRVNAISPGPQETRMMRSIEAGLAPHDPASARQMFAQKIPDGRYGQPDEVARLVLFLASDLASHITGESVAIDGGLLAG